MIPHGKYDTNSFQTCQLALGGNDVTYTGEDCQYMATVRRSILPPLASTPLRLHAPCMKVLVGNTKPDRFQFRTTEPTREPPRRFVSISRDHEPLPSHRKTFSCRRQRHPSCGREKRQCIQWLHGEHRMPFGSFLWTSATSDFLA